MSKRQKKPAPVGPTRHITVEIPEQRIEDLLCSAFEGGITYWVDGIGKEKRPKGAQYRHEYALKGGFVELKHQDGTARLDRNAIERGLQAFARECPSHFGDWISENDDANTADAFVQCCVFGEIVYG